MLSVMVLLSGGFAMLIRQSYRKAELRAEHDGSETEPGPDGPCGRDGNDRVEDREPREDSEDLG